MIGAVAGDIIGSPYEWNNADDGNFVLLDSNRNRRSPDEPVHHARITDESVLTLAAASWLMTDPDRKLSHLAGTITRLHRDNPHCGFSPMMTRWIESEGSAMMRDPGSAAAAMVSPIAMASDDITEAIGTARKVAQMLYRNDEAVNGACALSEAAWLARHGAGNDEIRYALENGYGYDLSMPLYDMGCLARGCRWESITVNGEDTGERYMRETGRRAFNAEITVTAAARAFLEGKDFEDTVRKAVALGGKSDTIASMAGALAGARYGIPEEIANRCSRLVPGTLKSIMELFEQKVGSRKATVTRAKRLPADTFQIIRYGKGEKLFVVDPRRKDIVSALKAKFGDDIRTIRPAEMKVVLQKLSIQDRDGTYLEKPRPDVRTIHFQNGEFRTSATAEGPGMAPQEERLKARSDFYRISDYAMEVKRKLQERSGYHGEGSIHYATAYYPEIFHDRIEIWKGDVLAGAAGIDPVTGLISVYKGGDFGPMEWDGERTDTVFSSPSPEDIMADIGRCCLDDGLRTSDIFVRSNLEAAFDDVASSKDSSLLKAVECSQLKSKGISQ